MARAAAFRRVEVCAFAAASAWAICAAAQSPKSDPRVVALATSLSKNATLHIAPRSALGLGHRGILVLAPPEVERAARSLARAVYAVEALRPTHIDESSASVLAGGPLPPSPSDELLALEAERSAIEGDDSRSLALLRALASRFDVVGIVWMEMVEGSPRARLFLAETGRFEPAIYQPDRASPCTGADVDGAEQWCWQDTAASLHRSFGRLSERAPERPASATERPTGNARPFYTSPWFWGAVGGALLVGGSIWLVTRDNGQDTIELQLRVPR